jgi:hypothetical protein
MRKAISNATRVMLGMIIASSDRNYHFCRFAGLF